MHSLSFSVPLTSLTAACSVLARRFASLGRRRWAVGCAATGVAIPRRIVLGMTSLIAAGVAFVMTGIVSSWWVAVWRRA